MKRYSLCLVLVLMISLFFTGAQADISGISREGNYLQVITTADVKSVRLVDSQLRPVTQLVSVQLAPKQPELLSWTLALSEQPVGTLSLIIQEQDGAWKNSALPFPESLLAGMTVETLAVPKVREKNTPAAAEKKSLAAQPFGKPSLASKLARPVRPSLDNLKNDYINMYRTGQVRRIATSTQRGHQYSIILAGDGSLITGGSSQYNGHLVSDWKDQVLSISAGAYHTLGLTFDGRPIFTGPNGDGQDQVNGWPNLVTVDCGGYYSMGLAEDGHCYAVGDNSYGQTNVSGWSDIVAISGGGYHSLGLRSNGTVMAVGRNDQGSGACNVSSWNGIVAISAGNWHSVGLRFDGTVVATGDNQQGQCNVGNWRDIVAVSAGVNYTVGLRADGTVVATGSGARSQLSGWQDVVAIEIGVVTIGITSSGGILVAGTGSATNLASFQAW